MKTKFNRERVRFDIKQSDTLVIQGWFEEEQPEQAVFEAFLDGKETELTVQTRSQKNIFAIRRMWNRTIFCAFRLEAAPEI